MNENNTSKRREWVKNAAIIFLSILLVLTFFSNTIMNYSLPEVAAQYVESGTITAKIRGTGTIESGDPYNIMTKETRKVTSVAVRVGDQVQKGDVLIYLEEGEGEELKAAAEALEAAQKDFDTILLTEAVTEEVLEASTRDTPVSTYRQQITNLQNEREAAQKRVDSLTQQSTELGAMIESIPEVDVTAEKTAVNEATIAYGNATFALTEAQNRLTAIQSQLEYERNKLEYENSISNGDLETNETNTNQVIKNLSAQEQEASLVVLSAQTAANNAKLVLDKATTELSNKQASAELSDEETNLTNQQKALALELQEAENLLTQKTTELQTLLGNISQVMGLESAYERIADAQEAYDAQKEKAMGTEIVAEISGTVTAINAAAGKEVSAAEPVVILQPEGQGYTMSFSVTNEQARTLSVGDKAELVNSWRYDDMDITLASIKTDPSNPSQNKILNFNVIGDVIAGQTLNVSIGQKSSNFDCIVPNSAVREDNNGKFILIVEAKSSPLGNRYIATRVDVEVLASDDTKSAVSGALYGYEFVITTSTQPVEAGNQVRLSDASK